MGVFSDRASIHAMRAVTWVRSGRSVVQGAFFSLHKLLSGYNQNNLDSVGVSLNRYAIWLTGMIEMSEQISVPASVKYVIFVIYQMV